MTETKRIHSSAFVGPQVVIVGSCTIEPGAVLGQTSIVEGEAIVLEDGVVIGANSTVSGSLRIGRAAEIRPGSAVRSDVPAFAIVEGNPARIVGYVATESELGKPPVTTLPAGLDMERARLIPFKTVSGIRGSLSVAECEEVLDFIPRRFFMVHSVPTERTRGGHAHRVCEQLLVATHGQIHVIVDDGKKRTEVILDSPDFGLHLGPMVWATQYRYSTDSVLLVLASHTYDPDDYIRDYDQYLHSLESLPQV